MEGEVSGDFVINNQIQFNSYINYYFDNKTIINQSKKKYKNETITGSSKIVNFFRKDKLKNKTSKITISNFYTHDRNKVTKKIKFLISKNKFLKESLACFLVHGSYASNDYISQWSDIDTFVVIKNSILRDQKKIIKLRKEIGNFYSYFYKICRFQHHGLILFTENDLLQYQNNFLPIEALSPCVKILGGETLQINICKNKKNMTFKKLNRRLKDFELAPKIGIYKHHPKKLVYLEYPIKTNSNQMFQLHVIINYVISLPIYFLTAVNKSTNKKYSFKKFYKIVKNTRVRNTIENSRFIRKNWKVRYDDKIPPWVVKKLGQNYFEEIVFSMKIILKKIKKHNKLNFK